MSRAIVHCALSVGLVAWCAADGQWVLVAMAGVSVIASVGWLS